MSKKKCNCRNRAECPLDGRCMEEAIVYEATLKTKTGADNYVGIVEKDFKSRYYNHKTSFNNSTKRNATALSAKYHDAVDNK